MITIDFHTHIFSEAAAADRTPLLTDPVFAELYSAPSSRMTTADEMLDIMKKTGVGISAAMGFPWSDEKFIEEQNGYILDSAKKSSGKIIPFASVPLNPGTDYMAILRSLKNRGFAGIGEIAFYKTGFGPDQEILVDRIFKAAAETQMPVCLHMNEPVGHSYSGKYPTPFGSIVPLIEKNPDTKVILAHWGGGIIFYELMPEIKNAFKNVWYDTAASNYLYSPDIYRAAITAAGPGKILFGSDSPLADPRKCISSFEGLLSADEKHVILSRNSAKLLNIK